MHTHLTSIYKIVAALDENQMRDGGFYFGGWLAIVKPSSGLYNDSSAMV
jgi:hypothetical protein